MEDPPDHLLVQTVEVHWVRDRFWVDQQIEVHYDDLEDHLVGVDLDLDGVGKLTFLLGLSCWTYQIHVWDLKTSFWGF